MHSDRLKHQKGFGALALLVAIALVAAIGGFYLYQRHTSKVAVTMENQQPTGTQPSPVVTGVTSPSDTSNTALDKDTQNINAEINALNSDSVNVNSSLNVTPESLQ